MDYRPSLAVTAACLCLHPSYHPALRYQGQLSFSLHSCVIVYEQVEADERRRHRRRQESCCLSSKASNGPAVRMRAEMTNSCRCFSMATSMKLQASTSGSEKRAKALPTCRCKFRDERKRLKRMPESRCLPINMIVQEARNTITTMRLLHPHGSYGVQPDHIPPSTEPHWRSTTGGQMVYGRCNISIIKVDCLGRWLKPAETS